MIPMGSCTLLPGEYIVPAGTKERKLTKGMMRIMNKKTLKRQRDLKTKLMAAISMLLVSSLMMVTSTYAWFTLSTAPEVTGITTAVGANGNLEMALLPPNGLAQGATAEYGITSEAGDSQKIPVLRNITWGNLVDVSDDASYGLSNLNLYPSQLNIETSGEGDDAVYKVGARPLATPQYGVDGRVSTVEANTITGAFDTAKGQFIENANGVTNAMGVRAIGVSSSMTARNLAYRNAVGNAISYKGQSQNVAKTSLNARGNDLASIAIKHALGNDSAGYTLKEIGYLKAAVEDLVGALGHLETSLKNYIIADSIAPSTVTDDTYKTIVDSITAVEDLENVDDISGAVVTAEMADLISKLGTAVDNAELALSKLNALSAGATWNQISEPLNLILNTDTMEINGLTMSQILAADPDGEDGPEVSGKDRLVDQIIEDDFNVIMVMYSGSGAYSDIADFAGQYSATTEVTVSYGPIKDKDIPATMTAVPDAEGTVYLDNYDVAVFADASGDATTNPISEFYGYIIDLAFRTNASDSYLNLQVEGIDRVYSDSTTNENTQGGGANMSFKSSSSTFQPIQVKSLMSNIRIVFFDPETSEIIGYAKLDMNKATTGSDNVTITAPLALTDSTFANLVVDNDGTTNCDESIAIMELTQNTAHLLSVMVYLDGRTMRNADVAADNIKSMVGSMNLQFSSSATLRPMEYSDLRAENGGASSMITISNVTAPEGYKASSAYMLDNQLAFTLAGVTEGQEVYVSINGGEAVKATAGNYMGMTGYAISVNSGTEVTSVTITVSTPGSNTPATT